MVQCELKESIDDLCEAISKHMEQAIKVIDSEGFKLAFQAVTLQGDRIAVFLTGSKISKSVRTEVRSSSIESHTVLGTHLETFLRDVSTNLLNVLL